MNMRIWYFATTPECAVGETFAKLDSWSEDMFDFPALPGSRRALGVFDLPDDLPLLDLDDPQILLRRGLRPSGVVSLNRKVDPGRKVALGMRPEHLQLDPENGPLAVTIRSVESTGSMDYYTTRTTPEIMLVEQGRSRFVTGDTARLRIAAENVHLFDATSGLAI